MSSYAKLRRSLVGVLALVALAAGLGACKTVNRANSRFDTTVGAKHKVENVHQQGPLSEKLRRVALLPMHPGRYGHIDLESVEENFIEELQKRNLFEVVTISPEEMRDHFGSERFSSVEHLPTKLIQKLHDAYAIDGIMFIDLTYFEPYQPVGIGVRAKLLDGRTGELVWAADELFDASNPAVSNAARKYYQTESTMPYPMHATQSVLHSPTRFSKYVADAIFQTIR